LPSLISSDDQMAVKLGEYKGHPIISLLKDENDARPFTFGMGKARLILDNLEDIRKFVEDNAKE
jgi:hypothetical protein